jgi:hypothetical protein
MNNKEKFAFAIRQFAGTKAIQSDRATTNEDRHYYMGFEQGLMFALYWAGCSQLAPEQSSDFLDKHVDRQRAGL